MTSEKPNHDADLIARAIEAEKTGDGIEAIHADILEAAGMSPVTTDTEVTPCTSYAPWKPLGTVSVGNFQTGK